MNDKLFIDSNIWVYAFANDDSMKRSISECFIDEISTNSTFVISWQVMNEVANVLHRKKIAEPDLRRILDKMSKICIIHNFSENILNEASHLRETLSVSFWDSLVIATAVDAQCSTLVSEDLQHGQVIKGMKIQNIFTHK